MADEPGLRERKKLDTRARITAAALALALERGLEATTVEDIAAQAEISPRTFFNYFPTKEAALVADDLARARLFLDTVAAAPRGTPVWDLLVSSVLDTLATTELPSRQQALKEQLVRTSPSVAAESVSAFARLERELVELLRTRDASLDPLHVRLLAASLLAGVNAATETWLAGTEDDAEAFRAHLTQALRILSAAFPAHTARLFRS